MRKRGAPEFRPRPVRTPARHLRRLAMTITRKQFLDGATATTVLLLFQGCGGGGGGYGSPAPASAPAPAPAPAPASGCGASGSQIADNHGHVLSIPSADLDSMVDKTYGIM